MDDIPILISINKERTKIELYISGVKECEYKTFPRHAPKDVKGLSDEFQAVGKVTIEWN